MASTGKKLGGNGTAGGSVSRSRERCGVRSYRWFEVPKRICFQGRAGQYTDGLDILSGKHPTEPHSVGGETESCQMYFKAFHSYPDDLLSYSSDCYSKESIWVFSKGIQLAKTLLWNSGDATDHTSEAGL